MAVFRIEPLMPVQNYRTYGMSMPLSTHWVPATCEEFDCAAFLNGWVTTIDLSTELGQKQYHFLTHDKTRTSEQEKLPGTLVKFTFAPGNTCFSKSEHKLPLGRPASFYTRGGDWRGNPGGERRVHKRAEDWIEDFSENQDRLNDLIERG